MVGTNCSSGRRIRTQPFYKEFVVISGEGFLWFVFLMSLALIGFRKMWGNFDAGGKVKKAAQDGLAAKIGKWLS